jgi:3-isopropylmalate dehydrogenase
MAEQFKIGLISGDGIGPEVMIEALKVLAAVSDMSGVKFEVVPFEVGAQHYLKTGEILGDDVLREIKTTDAILLGAVGDPQVPPGLLERELLLRLRFELDLYLNLRPIRLFAGVESPLRNSNDIDFIVCREGTEGLYAGKGSIQQGGTTDEVAIEESVNTYKGIERIIRYAFELASARKQQLTLIHKTNVLTRAGGLWQRIFAEVGGQYPNVSMQYFHVDAAAMFFVTKPEIFDVVVTDNLFGDILTDLGAAITGGIGLAASGNINPERTTPSMFEPIHGSAPDIAGQQLADPTAAILSVKMMLEHLGLHQEASWVEQAVATDLLSRTMPRNTSAIGNAIVQGLKGRDSAY